MKLSTYIVILITVFSMQYSMAQEKNHPWLTDKLIVGGGVYFPVKTVKIKVNGSVATPLEDNNFDFGESFGFDDSQATLSLNAEWRFSKNWKISSQYFSIDNAKKAELKEDIEWEDYIFKKGSFVRGGFSIDMYRIFFGRNISTGQKHELGAGLGVHLMDVGAFIDGKAYINDQEVGDKLVKADVIAPLPNVGAWYYYAPFKNLIFTAKLDWFGISIDEFSGSLWNISPGVNYQLFNRLGIGLNYRFFEVSARVDKEDWDGRFGMSFSGPLLSISTNF